MNTKKILLGCLFLFISSLAMAQTERRYKPADYIPESYPLYNTILRMDSIYFDTYNTCNLEKMGALMSDSLEFYHDQGGLSTSKKQTIEGVKNNICGKVTRELVKGSVEVYPIKDFGAVEIGYHTFRNNTEPKGSISNPDKFIIIWQFKDNNWKITRVVSLH